MTQFHRDQASDSEELAESQKPDLIDGLTVEMHQDRLGIVTLRPSAGNLRSKSRSIRMDLGILHLHPNLGTTESQWCTQSRFRDGDGRFHR